MDKNSTGRPKILRIHASQHNETNNCDIYIYISENKIVISLLILRSIYIRRIFFSQEHRMNVYFVSMVPWTFNMFSGNYDVSQWQWQQVLIIFFLLAFVFLFISSSVFFCIIFLCNDDGLSCRRCRYIIRKLRKF